MKIERIPMSDEDHAQNRMRFLLTEEVGNQFRAWLAQHDREVRAQALRDAADAMDADPAFRDPLRLKAQWVRDRADAEERGER